MHLRHAPAARPFLCVLSLIAAVAAAAPAWHASAQVVLTAIDRSVFVRAYSSVPSNPNYGSQESYENHSAGPWNGSGVLGPGVGEEAGHGSAAAVVGLQSDLTPVRFAGIGTTSLDLSSSGVGSSEASTRAVCAVTFQAVVTMRVDFEVFYQGTPGSRTCRLERVGGPLMVQSSVDHETTLTLTPGVYAFYAEIGAAGVCAGSCALTANRYMSFDLTFHSVCPADIGAQGGLAGQDEHLDNNDFVVFIDYFFNHHPLADRGVQGGMRGSDGLFDNNDFVVFIDDFFGGCPS